MTTIGFQRLYQDRCRAGKPHYWKVEKLSKTNYAVDDSGIDGVISRVIAASLVMEIDVREYIKDVVTKLKDNDVSPAARLLLESNINDENVHYNQFVRAQEAHKVLDTDLGDAFLLSEQWINADAHPLQKAALLEVGVFVSASLPVILRCGDHGLAWLSQMVAGDEQRHVATNLGCLQKLGMNPFEFPENLESLRRETISWLIGDFKVKEWGLSNDWFIKQSDSMVSQGYSAPLEMFTSAYRDTMPFEVSNTELVYY
jgi:hypothetical protein